MATRSCTVVAPVLVVVMLIVDYYKSVYMYLLAVQFLDTTPVAFLLCILYMICGIVLPLILYCLVEQHENSTTINSFRGKWIRRDSISGK